jgi:hypothetical protein
MDKYEKLVNQCNKYKEALEIIANPLAYFQMQIAISGNKFKLDETTRLKISKDLNWLKNIAIQALKEE